MTRVNMGRIFDVARAMTTKAGRDIPEVLQFLSDFGELALRALRNGVSLNDNVDCRVVSLFLKHNVNQQIDAGVRIPEGVVVLKTISTTTAVDSFNFFYDATGLPMVRATFTGSPTEEIQVRVVIFY